MQLEVLFAETSRVAVHAARVRREFGSPCFSPQLQAGATHSPVLVPPVQAGATSPVHLGKLCAPDSLPIVGWLFILANWRTIKLGRKPLMG